MNFLIKCDQIWKNVTNLVKVNINIFSNLFRVHSVNGKLLNLFWEIFLLLGKFSLF